MHIRDKILLWISLPILWVWLFSIIPKPESIMVDTILTLISFVVFIILFINIFVQIYMIDKSSKKNVEVRKQINEASKIWKKKYFWSFFIVIIIVLSSFYFIIRNFEMSIYFKVLLGIIDLIIIFVIVKWMRV